MTTTTPNPQGRSWKFVRLTAPAVTRLAGRRFFPLWAVVQHRGRRTGRALTVPVAVVATPEAFLIALPWGPGTNWARNVLAADGCLVRWKGRDHPVVRPELLDVTRARPYFGAAAWFVSQRVFHARTFLLLHR
jgi:hypothetical protein